MNSNKLFSGADSDSGSGSDSGGFDEDLEENFADSEGENSLKKVALLLIRVDDLLSGIRFFLGILIVLEILELFIF